MIIAPKALIFGRASFRYVRPSVVRRPSSVRRLSALFFGTLKMSISEYDTRLELLEKGWNLHYFRKGKFGNEPYLECFLGRVKMTRRIYRS